MSKKVLLYLIFIIGLVNFWSCKDQKSPSDSVKENVETIEVYNFKDFEKFLTTDTEKIHIVNFWAMWCAPCVAELPILQEYAENNKNVELLLVSLDFPEDIKTKLQPFLKKKGITSKVIILDEPDANSWINKINPNWSGAIPYTIIFNNKKRSYHERAFIDIDDLNNEIINTFN